MKRKRNRTDMKYLIRHNDNLGNTQEIIKEFSTESDFDEWKAVQSVRGMDITEITNILYSIKLSSGLVEDEFRMLIRNIDCDVDKINVEFTDSGYEIEVTNNKNGFTLVEVNNELTIFQGMGDSKKEHYFTRGNILMFMEMFRGKYLYAN